MNSTASLAAQESPKIQRTGDAQQLGLGPVPVSRQRPAMCDWADRLAEFDVDAACQGVAFQLASFASKNGGCFPSVATLAQRVKMGERQCRRHLRTLARKGLIQARRRGRGHTNAYQLHGYGWASSDRPSRTESASHDRSCTTGHTSHDRSCTTAKGSTTKVVHTPRARERVTCETHGRSWPASWGPFCYECAQERAKRPEPKRQKRMARATLPARADDGWFHECTRLHGARCNGQRGHRLAMEDAGQEPRIRAERGHGDEANA